MRWCLARYIAELRLQARQKYWGKILERVRLTSTLQGIWHHVSRVRGRATIVWFKPPTLLGGQSFLHTWVSASAVSGVSATHRDALALTRHRPRRMTFIHQNISQVDDTCVPVTHEELFNAIKRGKSTGPSQDGSAYGILNSSCASRQPHFCLVQYIMCL